MREAENRIIRCPVCHKGRIFDAAEQTDLSTLHLYSPRQSAKADWFTKCPKCGTQIGIAIQPKLTTEQQRAGA